MVSEQERQSDQDKKNPRSKISMRFILLCVLSLGLMLTGGILVYQGWQNSLPAYTPPEERLEVPEIVDEVRLAVFGDWGSGDRNQIAVRDALEIVAHDTGGFHGGLLLGDNFYWDGVKSLDDPKWRLYFEEPYDTRHLGRLPWYAVLGNHDYKGNVQAQIDYTKKSQGRWHMPAHYFRIDFGPKGTQPFLSVFALDTNPEFKATPQWQEQLAWLEAELKKLEKTPSFKIVMGHHPIASYSKHGSTPYLVEELDPLLKKYGVELYLCGHDHVMQQIEQKGSHYAVIGSGGKKLYELENQQGKGLLFGAEEYGFALLRVRKKSGSDKSQASLSLEYYDSDAEKLYTWKYPEASD